VSTANKHPRRGADEEQREINGRRNIMDNKKQDYPLPRTLAEALRKGYEWDFGIANTSTPDRTRETGIADFILMNGGECVDLIQVPYTATFKYGRPQKENQKQ
jgi:hypothetical protein